MLALRSLLEDVYPTYHTMKREIRSVLDGTSSVATALPSGITITLHTGAISIETERPLVVRVELYSILGELLDVPIAGEVVTGHRTLPVALDARPLLVRLTFGASRWHGLLR